MLRAFGKVGGIVLFFIAFGVGFGAWVALSSAIGETQRVKGLCFVIGGTTASLLDILWRWNDGKAINRETLFADEYGAHLGHWGGIPFWTLGIVGVIGGIYLAFFDPY